MKTIKNQLSQKEYKYTCFYFWCEIRKFNFYNLQDAQLSFKYYNSKL